MVVCAGQHSTMLMPIRMVSTTPYVSDQVCPILLLQENLDIMKYDVMNSGS